MIFIERKEITQGVKDYYDYKADCKNLWFFCKNNDDEDFVALVIHGLSGHLDSRYPASVHSNFRQCMENTYQADAIAGVRTQAVFWPYADKIFEEMRGIAINKGTEDGRFWAQTQEERQHRSRRGNATRAASFQDDNDEDSVLVSFISRDEFDKFKDQLAADKRELESVIKISTRSLQSEMLTMAQSFKGMIHG